MADLGDVEQGLVGGGGGGDEGGREGGLWAGHRPRKLRKFAQSLNIFYIFDILGSSAMYTGNRYGMDQQSLIRSHITPNLLLDV